jgi:hypothetical protein
MEKEFVPYKEALALKKLGLNIPCIGKYWNSGNPKSLQVVQQLSGDFHFKTITNDKTKKEKIDKTNIDFYTAAPTYSQTFRWFREKGYHFQPLSKNGKWAFFINNLNKLNKDGYPISELIKIVDYETYEEAELECLRKLIEIVKNNE